jgi:hypothetical protein
MTTRDWGVVLFEIDADTKTSLIAALTIAMTYSSKITHYAIQEKDAKATPMLVLRTNGEGSPNIHPLLSPIENAADGVDQLWGWLKTAKYPPQPVGGDGSFKKGFKAVAGNSSVSIAMTLTPHWIYYGK